MTANINLQHKIEIGGKTYTKVIIVILLLTIVFLAGNWYGTATIKGNNRTLDNSTPTVTSQLKKRVEETLNEFTGGFIGQGSNGDPSIQYFIQNPSMSVGFGVSTIKMLIKDNNGINSLSYTKISQTFPNSNPVTPQVIGPIVSHSTYFMGSSIGTTKQEFSTIIYKNLYNHIDLEYTIKNGGLKYNFYVNPGGNSNDIQIQWHGPVTLEKIAQGMQIIISTHAGQRILLDKEPVSMQPALGKTIVSSYSQIDVKTYSFNINPYNTKSMLVIDPSFLLYSSFFGGSNYGFGNGITVDSLGNVYITGSTSSADFPTFNAYNSTFSGYSDVFIIKLSAGDSSVVYSTYIGGKGASDGNAIAVDSSGHAYVTGDTSAPNFPMINGFNKTYGGGTDVFVLELSKPGTSILYSIFIGGSNEDIANAIAIDSVGNAYVAGNTYSTNFPMFYPYTSTAPGGGNYWDSFVFCLSAGGTAMYYSSYFGGSKDDHAYGISIDKYGNAYVTGTTNSANFPTTTGAFNRTFNSGNGVYTDAFVFKISYLNYVLSLDYSTFIGGSYSDDARGIAVDSNNNTYVTGFTGSPDFPTINAYNQTFNNGQDGFVLKLSADGSKLIYSTFVGGTGSIYNSAITLDQFNNAYVAGYTNSRNFPLTSNAYDKLTPSYWKTIIFELSSSGKSLLYSTYVGGEFGSDSATGIALDSHGNIYSTGSTTSSDFPITPNAYESYYTANINGETFVYKLAIPSNASLTPGQPIVIVSNATHSLGLIWNAPTFLESFQHYNIYRGTSAGNYSLIGTSLDSHFVDYSITLGVTYHYAVAPVYTTGFGYKSADVSGVLLSTSSTVSNTSTSTNTSKGLPGFESLSAIFLLAGSSVIILAKRKKK